MQLKTPIKVHSIDNFILSHYNFSIFLLFLKKFDRSEVFSDEFSIFFIIFPLFLLLNVFFFIFNLNLSYIFDFISIHLNSSITTTSSTIFKLFHLKYFLLFFFLISVFFSLLQGEIKNIFCLHFFFIILLKKSSFFLTYFVTNSIRRYLRSTYLNLPKSCVYSFVWVFLPWHDTDLNEVTYLLIN